MAVVQFAVGLVDRFVPPQLLRDEVTSDGGGELFRARLTIGFCLVIGTLFALMVAIRILQEGKVSSSLAGLIVGVLAIALLPSLTRWWGTHRPAAMVLLCVGLVLIPVRALDTGGLMSTVIPWFTLAPVVAWMSLGMREGLVTLFLAMTGLVIVTNAEALGFVVQELDMSAPMRLVSMGVLLVILSMLAWTYNLERQGQVLSLTRVLTRLEQANRDLEVKSSEAQQAAEAKAQFLAAMSHELRTPLNGVMGMSYMLVNSELSEEQATWARTIDSSASLLMTVIDDVLQVSRLEAGKVELLESPYSPHGVLDGVAALLRPSAHDKGLELLVETDANVPDLLIGDDVRLRQIMINLAGNAIKFTDAGAVTIRSGRVAGLGGNCRLRLEVSDTGIGIAEDARERIFGRFNQADAATNRQFGGTGLGLSICKGLVEAMGGQIGVHSQLGHGSVFWVEIPLQVCEYVAPEEETEEPASVETGARILVVEDNAVNQLVAKQFLLRLGHSPHVVDGGEEALDAVSREHFDLVLMDCQMPGMDGYEATRRLRALVGPAGKVPVVALTAHALPEAVQACFEAGMDDHLAKPLALMQLSEVLSKYLGRRAA